MAIHTICPHCNKLITSPEEMAGQSRPCPHCLESVRIPTAPVVAASKPPEDSGQHAEEEFPWMHAAKKKEYHDLIDMTAMVDIVFFLLIFFLVTSFVAMSAAIQAPTSEGTLGKTARANAEQTSLQPVTVKIDEDGIIWLDQDSIQGIHDLTVRLRAAREETGADGLRIAANPEATHGKVVMVLDAGVSAGFEKAQLAVEEAP